MSAVLLAPDQHRAVVFDLDGVVTDTAALHFRAWKQLFDEFLEGREPAAVRRRFTEEDYREYVDGKPREEGVRSLLSSCGISLPEGEVDDPDDRETVRGLGNRKNRYFRRRLETEGVKVFDSTVELVRELQGAGIRTAVISASRNCELVLEMAGLGELFPVRVDGVVADELGLPGKPDPAVFVEAARRLHVAPADAVVVEDSGAGVSAGDAHEFALVIGVARDGRPGDLRECGADVVVTDLAEVSVSPRSDTDDRDTDDEIDSRGDPSSGQRPLSVVPDALESWNHVVGVIAHRSPVFFLDFDGTLAPIVDDPTEVVVPATTRSALQDLAAAAPVAVVSGRDLRDVRERVALDAAWFAGSHGFEIAGPDGSHQCHPAAEDAAPTLDDAERESRERLDGIGGVTIDRKRYALAVHYRRIDDDVRIDEVIDVVHDIARSHGLRVTEGRKVVELRPDVDWHKGRAVDWILDAIVPDEPAAMAVYAGDDLTDEDALAAVRVTGLGIVVRSDEQGDRPTHAHVAVAGVESLAELLERFARALAR